LPSTTIEGLHRLAALHAQAPFCEESDRRPRPGQWPSHRSTLRLVRPCGFPWWQRQDASNPFLQPTFHVTSTRDKHHLWRLPAEPPWETRQRSTSRSGPGPRRFRRSAGTTPDHLAVIWPPTTVVLDGTTPASGRSTATVRRSASGGEHRRFFGCRMLRRYEPSDTSRGRPGGRKSGPGPVA